MCGMIRSAVRVDGAGRNLRSSNDGGVFNNPMADLCRLRATLVDAINVNLALLATVQAHVVFFSNGSRMTINIAIRFLC